MVGGSVTLLRAPTSVTTTDGTGHLRLVLEVSGPASVVAVLARVCFRTRLGPLSRHICSNSPRPWIPAARPRLQVGFCDATVHVNGSHDADRYLDEAGIGDEVVVFDLASAVPSSCPAAQRDSMS